MPEERGASLIRDTSGAAAVVIALGLPLFIGGLGFGTEVGYWRLNQAKLQNAADVAAYAAAAELRAGRSAGELTLAAAEAAAEIGYVPSRGTLATNWPPESGIFAGDQAAVEVRLEERLPRLFSALFGEGDVRVSGRAVARISAGSPTCVLALHPTAPGALTFTGSAVTTFVGCNVHSNSIAQGSAAVTGSAEVETGCLSTAGTATVSADLTLTRCVAAYENAEVATDPFAHLPAPDVPAGCEQGPANSPNSTLTIKHGTYCSLDLKGTLLLEPGVYVIKGDLTINAQANVSGSGVTLYFDGAGEARFNGGATIQLKAPTTGPLAGVLLFGDRDASGVEHRLNGNAGSFLHGVVYAREGSVSVLGGGSAAGCTKIVARTVTFSGNSEKTMDCTGWGFHDIRTARLITLVE